MGEEIWTCEHCGKNKPASDIHMHEDCWLCLDCEAEHRKGFEACQHKWEPHVTQMGDDAQYCPECHTAAGYNTSRTTGIGVGCPTDHCGACLGCASEAVRLTFGKAAGQYVALLFSARLDETGTDGRSRFTVVAGGVAIVEQWDRLEKKWTHRLAVSKVDAFHTKEFNERSGDFEGWGDLKHKRFAAALDKIIRQTTYFDCAVAVDNAAHAQVKREMKGIKGFKYDSNYGVAFRLARLHICNVIAAKRPDARVQFIVEDGPWASDAGVIYQKIAASKNTQANAHMLAGFAALPKGALRSLEAADFLAGMAIADLAAGNKDSRTRRHFILADQAFLHDQYYAGMIREKERHGGVQRGLPRHVRAGSAMTTHSSYAGGRLASGENGLKTRG